MENHELELNYDDILKFSSKISYHELDGEIIVVSEDTGNWIVLKNHQQLDFLSQLMNGVCVGNLIDAAKDDISKEELVYVLQCVLARNFAGINCLPQSRIFDTSKKLCVYLTTACNLHCKHCFMNAGTPKENELTTKEWIRVLDEFSSIGGEEVTFSGGEPLLHKGFDEILIHANSIGLKTTILSNGLLWNDSKIKLLSPFIDEIQLSLDGVDEDSTTKVRGHGVFNKVVKTIVSFANHGVRTSVATTFTPDNLTKETAELYVKLHKEIESQTGNSVFFRISKKLLKGRGFSLTNEQQSMYSESMKRIEKLVNPNAEHENFMEGHLPNLIFRNCGFGGISISSTGDAYLCNRILETNSLGSIRNYHLKHFYSIGKEINEKTSVDNAEPCKDCYLKYICGGGCRIDNFSFKGKIKNLDGNCKQIACDDNHKTQILRSMATGFKYMYSFGI